MSELLLIVRIAGERVAFPAAEICSVVEIETLTPVPRVPGFVAGISALRSRPMTVIDGAAAMGLGQHAAGAEVKLGRAVVVEEDRHLYAILVDCVEDIVSQTAPAQAAPTGLVPRWQRIAKGLAETTAGTVLLGDPLRLIAGPEQDRAA